MPWIAATASRPLGRNSPTRSPRPTPQRARRVARRSAARAQVGIGQRPAVLVLDGRVLGPPRGGLVEQGAEVEVESFHGFDHPGGGGGRQRTGGLPLIMGGSASNPPSEVDFGGSLRRPLDDDGADPSSLFQRLRPRAFGHVPGLVVVKQGIIERPVLHQRAGQAEEEPAVAERVGMVVPGGDLELAPGRGGRRCPTGRTAASAWWAAIPRSRATALGAGVGGVGLADAGDDHARQRHARRPAIGRQGPQRVVVDRPVEGAQLPLDVVLVQEPFLGVERAGRRR